MLFERTGELADTLSPPFRKSLRDQIVEWMEANEEDRKYKLPLSPRQFNAIMDYNTVVKARVIETRLYNSPSAR